MNMSVEVNSGLKQLKSGVEVCINTIGKSDRTSYSLETRFIYNTCGTDKIMKSRFIYDVCGYHISPIPSQPQSKLEIAHPSPLLQILSIYKRLLSVVNLVAWIDKVNTLIKWYYTSVLNRLLSVNHVFSGNINNHITSTIEYNKVNSTIIHTIKRN